MVTQFLGHELEYWVELQRRFVEGGSLRAPDLLEEIVQLRGRLAFHEARIREMAGLIR